MYICVGWVEGRRSRSYPFNNQHIVTRSPNSLVMFFSLLLFLSFIQPFWFSSKIQSLSLSSTFLPRNSQQHLTNNWHWLTQCNVTLLKFVEPTFRSYFFFFVPLISHSSSFLKFGAGGGNEIMNQCRIFLCNLFVFFCHLKGWSKREKKIHSCIQQPQYIAKKCVFINDTPQLLTDLLGINTNLI